MTEPELPAELIAEAMHRAEWVACESGHARCVALSDPVSEARQTCTPKGRCTMRWIMAEGNRTSFDVWLDVQTGEGRLRRRSD